MLSFRTYLEALKASSRDLPIQDRLPIGWANEALVIAVLEKFIGPTTISSEQADKRDKLDATIENKATGRSYLAQIKARESGDDILVEWYKDYYNKDPARKKGKDQATLADLYITMDSSKTWVYISDMRLIRQIAGQMVADWEAASQQQGQTLPMVKSPYGVVRFQEDRNFPPGRVYKVIAYLYPNRLNNAAPTGFPAKIKVPDYMKTPQVLKPLQIPPQKQLRGGIG